MAKKSTAELLKDVTEAPGQRDEDVVGWLGIDTERDGLRAIVVKNADRWDMLADRARVGHQRLHEARMAQTPVAVAAVLTKLGEIQGEMVVADSITKRLLAIRGFEYLKTLFGEGKFTIEVDDFRYEVS